MSSRLHQVALASAALLAGTAIGTPALAQADQPAAEAASADSGDIVVTARRRAESVQSVPASVLAVSADQLARANIKGVAGLESIAPSFKIIPATVRKDMINLELRGISGTDVTVPQDPTVGVYVNEVIQLRPFGFTGSLFDIENVQVLYGPQGTLFGRNTTGGALLVSTRKPELGRISAESAITVGNYNRFAMEGIVNIPLGDTLALRLAGRHSERKGYTRDISTGLDLDNENYQSGRASLLWKPSDTFSNLTMVDYFTSNDNGSGGILTAVRPTGTTDPAFLQLLGIIRPTGVSAGTYPSLLQALQDQQARGPRATATGPNVIDLRGNPFRPQTHTMAFGVANTTTLNLSDAFNIKLIQSYRMGKSYTVVSNDGSALSLLTANLDNRQHNYTAELNFSGSLAQGALDYAAGFFFLHETGADAAATASGGATVLGSNSRGAARNRSYAAYAQGTYRVPGVEGLSVTLGGRYTVDKREVWLRSYNISTGLCSVFLNDTQTVRANPCDLPLSKVFRAFSYNASIDYRVSPDLLIYAAHRRGYRSGGFNHRATTPTTALPFEPEIAKDVEAGFKANPTLFGLPSQFNLAAYYTWESNIQRNRVTLAPGTTTIVTVTSNAGEAEIFGGELLASIRPSRNLTLGGSVGYADARFTKFRTSYPSGATFANGGGAVPAGTPVTLLNVPFYNYKWTFNLSANYDVPLGDDDQMLSFSAQYSHHSRGNYGNQSVPFSEPEGFIPPQGTLNAGITLRNVGVKGLSLRAFCENCADSLNIVSIQSIQQTFGYTTTMYAPPRMYGLEARIRY